MSVQPQVAAGPVLKVADRRRRVPVVISPAHGGTPWSNAPLPLVSGLSGTRASHTGSGASDSSDAMATGVWDDTGNRSGAVVARELHERFIPAPSHSVE